MVTSNTSLRSQPQPGTSVRMGVMFYSLTCYLVGVLTLCYLIFFIADMLVPVTINHGSGYAPELSGTSALIWNVCVVAIWGAQHSIMARPAFKKIWSCIVPVSMERSTYLLFVSITTVFLVGYWIPMPSVFWDLSGTAISGVLTVLYFFGWVVVLIATFLINHFHLFGLQQAYQYLQQQQSKQATFKTPLLYKLVRHPMMSGVLIALWAVPVMTHGRLSFNLLMTVYIFIGLYFEERNLADELGESYHHYQKTTPAVIPRLRARKKAL